MADRPKNLTLQDTLANQNENRQKRSDKYSSEKGLRAFFAWGARLSLLFVICAAPWMIASVIPGAQFIIAITLLLGLACWWIDCALTPSKSQIIPYVTIFVVLGMMIGVAQTFELPESLSSLMAGRQVEITQEYLQATDAESTRPVRLSLDVEGTWHQLRMLVIAVTCLLLGSRFFRTSSHLASFLTVILVNGVALTAFGLVQKFRFNGKLYWEIELTQGGIPFGPFVCRNNAAGYLVMCVAAGAGLLLLLMTKKEVSRPHQIVSTEIPIWRQVSTYVGMFLAQLDAKRIAIILACMFISVGVVATLSRGGVVSLLSAWIGGSLIYNVTRKPKFAGLLMAPVALLVVALATWVGFAGEVLDRFEKIDTLSESTIDARLDTWRDTLPAAFENGWFGAGLGSYRSVHRLYRTNPENLLFEYAENQYVQSLVEAGIPGFILTLSALLLAFWYVFFLLGRGSSGVTVGAGVFGAFLLTGQAIAGVFDFGWYIPANMILFASGVGVVAHHAHSLAGRLKKRTWLRFECPGWVEQGIILVAFLFSIFVVYDLYQKTAVFDVIRSVSRDEDIDKLTIDQANEKIETLRPMMTNSPTVRALNLLGDLHVHRARLQYLQLLNQGNPIAELDEEAQLELEANLWNLTGLVRIDEYLSSLVRDNDLGPLNQLKNQEFYQYDLPQALAYYRASQKRAPLQPATQMMIGQLLSILGSDEQSKDELEHAVALSPQNADFRWVASLILLQQNQIESATPHLKHYLSLEPEEFRPLMSVLTGRSSRQILPLDERYIYEEIIADDPQQLFVFAQNFLGNNEELRSEALAKADSLLTDISLSDSDSLKLKANINFAAGNSEVGIEFLESATRSNPNDQGVRFRLASSLFENERYQEALEQTEKLLRVNNRLGKYKALHQKIQTKLDELEKSGAWTEPHSRKLRNCIVGIDLKEVTS